LSAESEAVPRTVRYACSVFEKGEVQANDGERCAIVRLPNARSMVLTLAHAAEHPFILISGIFASFQWVSILTIFNAIMQIDA